MPSAGRRGVRDRGLRARSAREGGRSGPTTRGSVGRRPPPRDARGRRRSERLNFRDRVEWTRRRRPGASRRLVSRTHRRGVWIHRHHQALHVFLLVERLDGGSGRLVVTHPDGLLPRAPEGGHHARDEPIVENVRVVDDFGLLGPLIVLRHLGRSVTPPRERRLRRRASATPRPRAPREFLKRDAGHAQAARVKMREETRHQRSGDRRRFECATGRTRYKRVKSSRFARSSSTRGPRASPWVLHHPARARVPAPDCGKRGFFRLRVAVALSHQPEAGGRRIRRPEHLRRSALRAGACESLEDCLLIRL